MARSSGTMALPPAAYGQPKGHFWRGVGELDRYGPTYPDKEDVFEEYLSNRSMQPSRHVRSLSSSRGLMELHYDSMRKRQQERSVRPTFVHGPTMDRPFAATTGYGGFIPGKDSNNICGSTFANVSRMAHETRGRFFDKPMSGVTFTLTTRSTGRSHGLSRSQSLPQLQQASPTAGGSRGAPR
eukprot:CAMPEP_0168422188 /NCGR_PEP_ID=MMETSP0228-20121227/33668_1 /TAXON_ID=133427 /ORGANISM="Protoceratium reticulatum, Strain CCCM 535 (=CCMP 1889)" /LENGTH=182 /DNA_ID=CAMNT_0008436119 /DNA_START=21 /DNA_END=565 /DNA_ORIENTATION=+